MSDVLDGARLKLGRAAEHIRELEREIHQYLAREPCEFIGDAARDPSASGIRVRISPPPHLRLIVGDTLHNLRSSLELIYWELALQTGPKDPDRDRISFPIFATEWKFRAAQDGLSRYVPPDAIDVIESVQPFRTRNAALSLLRTLSNQDRHGMLGLVVIGIPSPEGSAAVVALSDSGRPPGRVEAVLHNILRHISAEVLPKFEPLFS